MLVSVLIFAFYYNFVIERAGFVLDLIIYIINRNKFIIDLIIDIADKDNFIIEKIGFILNLAADVTDNIFKSIIKKINFVSDLVADVADNIFKFTKFKKEFRYIN